MSGPPIAVEKEIKQLLEIAGTASDEAARSWLIGALAGAQSVNRAAKQRLLSADHNELLADLAKTARLLTKHIKRLRSYPYSWQAFWRAIEPATSGYVRRAVSEDEIKKAHRPARRSSPDDREILATLSKFERAVQVAKESTTGRPREERKQRVVDLAFGFFVRYSPLRPSGTRTGPFGKFARAFYAVALKRHPDDDGGLDRQIRAAMMRLPVEQERARRLSALGRNKSP